MGDWKSFFMMKGTFTPIGDFEAYIVGVGTYLNLRQTLFVLRAKGYSV